MDVHLRDLRYFVAVADELHFTRAAERLHVAQPTLSRQVGRLERQLGAPLFERHPHGVTLTDAGSELLERARDLLRRWEDAALAVAAAGDVLRVGLQTAVGRGLLLTAAQRTGRRLDLRVHPWTDPTGGLATGASDVAVVWLPLPHPRRYRWLALRDEPRWVVLPESHRLARRASVPFSELLDEPFVALPPEAGPLRDYWLALDARGGRPVRIGAVATGADEKLEAIGAGAGVCLLAEGNVPLYRRPGITALPVEGLAPCRLVVAWRADDRRAAVREFAEAVADR